MRGREEVGGGVVHQNIYHFRYLMDLDYEEDAAWECICNMHQWLLKRLFNTKTDYQKGHIVSSCESFGVILWGVSPGGWVGLMVLPHELNGSSRPHELNDTKSVLKFCYPCIYHTRTHSWRSDSTPPR